ncbi:AAA family ATPase [Fluviispira sanaruensis]|uniref:SMC domain-containing protein n=1 Tax=Fluviispira sanaruensis TaxID=2493639 RepID=A0A4V0P2T0_FLUSA|nr:AAA family ATPase [Fluviispira sanaruensis]BBH54297.1 SMC domain-containing protein [Fluviispira sanaruensis]
MKLLKIELENLNSLYGRHSIDFIKDLQSAPIFLIMGATGSGKSTLMDAMSLALFGQTPRLAKNKAEKDLENDSRLVMSRGTYSAYAQLTFQKTEHGQIKIYRATWQCERAFKKADGKFKDPRRVLEIFDPISENFLELISDHRPKFYEPYFEKVLENLSVHDFKRMVLLAQGEFAAFLKANEDERAEILERLTNTEIYKEIGKKAADKKKYLEEKVHTLRSSLTDLNILSEEDEEVLKSNKIKLELDIENSAQELKSIENGINWFLREEDLKLRVEQASEKFKEILMEITDNQYNFDRVDSYQKAKKAIDLILSERKLSEKISDSQADITDKKQLFSDLNTQINMLKLKIDSYKSNFVQNKKKYTEIKDEILKSRSLHQEKQRIIEENKTKSTMFSDVILEKNKKQTQFSIFLTQKNFLEQEKLKLLEFLKSDLIITYYSQKNSHLELDMASEAFNLVKKEIFEIISPYSHPNEKMNSYELEKNNLIQLQKKISTLIWEQKNLDEKSAKIPKYIDEISSLEQLCKDEKSKTIQLKSLLNEKESEIKNLNDEISNLSWAMEIAKNRRLLHDSQDCPLCGSKEHPYFLQKTFAIVDQAVLEKHQKLLAIKEKSEKNYLEFVAKINFVEATLKSQVLNKNKLSLELNQLTEQISLQCRAIKNFAFDTLKVQIMGQENFLDVLYKAEVENKKQYESIEKLHNILVKTYHNYNTQKDIYTEKKENHNKNLTKYNEILETITSQCEDFVLESFLHETSDNLHNDKLYFNSRNSFLEFKKADDTLKLLNNNILKTSLELDNLKSRENSLEQEIQSLQNRLKDIEIELTKYLSGEDPDSFEANLITMIEESENILKTAEQDFAELNNKISILNFSIENLTNSLSKLKFEEKELEEKIESELKTIHIQTKESAISLHISEEFNQNYSNLKNKLETEKFSLNENKLQREKDLKDHNVNYPFMNDQENMLTLQEKKNRLEQSILCKRNEYTDLHAKMINNDVNKSKISSKQKELEKIQVEYNTWLKLHQLIGIGEGNQFKKFAQILNLEELITKANAHLARFEKRYSLAPALDANGVPRLAFAIKDGYHADEARSFKTLSGGETFLVSLALALALADYRSVKMPVETILLDEGFGTLDPITLQTAMSALESLHSTGTQVGIISHVEVLKESIASRIIVEKLGNGHSCLRVEV